MPELNQMQWIKTYRNELVTAILISFSMLLLPLKQGLLSVVLIGLILNAIPSSLKSNPISRIKTNVFLKWSIIYGLIYIIGLLSSDNLVQAKFDVVQKLSIFILGILLVIGDLNFSKGLLWIKRLFLLSNLVAVLLCFYLSYHNYLVSDSLSEFNYVNFSHFLHPAFFSMYLCFCLALLFDEILNPNGIIVQLWMKILFIMIYVFTIYLLASKSGLITMLVLIGIFVFKFVQQKVKPKRFKILSITIALLLISTIAIVTSSSNRLATMWSDLNNIQLESDENIDTTGQRILVWSSAITIIKDNFWKGVGTGDDNDALHKEFQNRGYDFLYIKKLNAHNQYLQTFMALGIGGFLFFLAYTLLPLYYGWKHNDIILISFSLIIIINSLTESIFNRQAGIIFWTLWGFILMSNIPNHGKRNKNYFD
jgi:O-antigen ligase